MPHRLQLTAPQTLQWVEQPLAPLQADELLIQTLHGAISIGAELPQVMATDRSDLAPTYPKETGYESYGEVLAIGEDVSDIRVGDRVVAFYGHHDIATVRAAKVIPVPRDLPPQLALLTILSCDAAKGVHKLNPRPSDAVAVTGLGTIGLLTVFYLRHYFGLSRIDAVDPDERRHALAKQLGATRTVTSGNDLELNTYAAALECSGRQTAFAHLQEALVPHGQLCILSDGNYDVLSLCPSFYAKELRIVGSSDGLDYRAHADWFLPAARKTPALFKLFEQSVDWSDLIPCFEALQAGAKPLKVFVSYDW
ncbi:MULTISPECIES: zinc-binding dehydrogenase [unclassified Exiguobacterium]|uniref:zinc-binding dehydrogenase n=1 Tax=unclassified Exiguobacterium TaxID=2644629 RepID=UPI001BE9821A|nr:MULTISPECIES: zinc-binding dehydrogenase [unclassified Exiguobacterium]